MLFSFPSYRSVRCDNLFIIITNYNKNLQTFYVFISFCALMLLKIQFKNIFHHIQLFDPPTKHFPRNPTLYLTPVLQQYSYITAVEEQCRCSD